MDPNRLLIWIVCLSSGLNFVQAAVLTGLGSATALIPGFILLATVVVSLTAPEIGGWVGGALWAGLLLMPSLVFRQISGLIGRGKYGSAHVLARALSGLYRLYGLGELPRILKALVEAKQGNSAPAHHLLDHQQQNTSPITASLWLELFRTTARWEECLAWLTSEGLWTQLERDPGLGLAYLRALGETGSLRNLVHVYQQLTPQLEEASNPSVLPLAQLMVLAFCGQVETVTYLFNDSLSEYPHPIRRFWLATARQARGERAASQQEWQELSTLPDLFLANAIRRRRSVPLADPHRQLNPEDWHQVAQIGDRIRGTAQRWTHARATARIPYATYGLIGLNLAVFGLEVMLGGSTDLETLYFLGGLVPEQVGMGAWWRLLTATLLHYGPFHLVMNMLGLLVLGPFVEQTLGILRYLGVYWGAGIGSMAVITLLSLQGLSPTDFVVGASGSIMGMVGASAAILWWLWHKHQSRYALRQLRTIVLIIVLQLIFDLTTPQISVTGHISGLIIGFLISGIMVVCRNPVET